MLNQKERTKEQNKNNLENKHLKTIKYIYLRSIFQTV